MASLVDVVNHTATGGIDQIDIPYACSVTIRGRSGAVLVYDSATGTDYATIPLNASLSIDTHNMKGDELFLKGGNGEVIEIIYQVRR